MFLLIQHEPLSLISLRICISSLANEVVLSMHDVVLHRRRISFQSEETFLKLYSIWVLHSGDNLSCGFLFYYYYGHAIDHSGDCLHLTAAVQVQFDVSLYGICGGQSNTGANFLKIQCFPLTILLLPNAHFLSCIIWSWYCGQFIAQVSRNSVSPHPKNNNNSKWW